LKEAVGYRSKTPCRNHGGGGEDFNPEKKIEKLMFMLKYSMRVKSVQEKKTLSVIKKTI